MAIQPVPPLVLASEFPTNADRTAGVWNAKAAAWAGSENAMATSVRNIAVATQNNATEATTASAAAVPAAAQAVAARDQAVPAAAQAVAARDQAVPAAAQALDAAQRAEAAAASIEDGPVTSVNGKTGAVNLGIADVVAPGDIVAYGATEAAARAKIKAGFDYTRGQQTFTTSQTVSKSIFGDATYVFAEVWGGGQSGIAVVVAATSAGQGGAGGEYVSALIRVADLPTTIDIVIGAGGLGATSTSNAQAGANPGGDTSFGAFVIAPGGSSASRYAGRRGGVPRASTATPTDINSIDAGAAGGSAFDAATVTPGTSLRAGAGGAAVITAAGTAAVGNPGVAPGGGGGAARVNNSSGTATSGAGARGELRLKWW